MADITGTLAAENTLSGTLNVVYGKDGKSAYEVALANGFKGNETEWLNSLHGKDGKDGANGKDGYTPKKNVDYFDGEQGERGVSGVYVGSGDMPDGYNVQIDPMGEVLTLEQLIKKVASKVNKISSVTLLAAQWVGNVSPYYQVVNIAGTTENSKIDLNPTIEQLNIFHEKDITFVVGNNKGTITVYCIGQKPTNDYTMQVTITEVNAI